MNWVAIQKALHNWVVYCTSVSADHVVWSGQQAPRTTQPGIVLKVNFLQDDGLPWVDNEPNPLEIDPLTLTANATTDAFTAVAHGLATGDGPFDLVGSDLPLNTDDSTPYWIVRVDNDTFKVATGFLNAINGVTIDLGDAGSGVMALESNESTLRAGEEITLVQRSLMKATLTLQCFTNVGVGMDMAVSTLGRVNARRLLPTAIAILQDANIGVIQVGQVKALGGTQDLVLFEPRALVDVMIHLTSEETENITIIERTEITNEDTGHTWTVDGAE